MKQIFYNIRNLMKNEGIIFVVIMVCIITSAFVLNFSYGLYKNFETAKQVAVDDLETIGLEFNKDTAPTHQQFQDFVESLSASTLDRMWFYVSGTVEEFENMDYPYLDSRFIYRNGKYSVATEFRKNAEDNLHFGRMITDEEENEGANVTCISVNFGTGEPTEQMQLLLTDDDTLVFRGVSYEVVGGSAMALDSMIIPFQAVPDDFVYDDVVIFTFDGLLTREVYQDLIASASTYMPNALTFPEMDLPDNDTISIFDNIIAIAILISIFSALNFVLLYQFILKKRTHDMAVLRVCGCGKLRLFCTYIGECLCISIPFYAVGTGIYALFMRFVLQDIYPYISEAHSLKIYAIIFAIYIVTVAIVVGILILSHMNHSIVSQLKEKKI